MDFDFYLSEMSVSDLHGGGLTLQRVLGADLMSIPNFVYVHRLATDLPPADQYSDRSIYIEPFWQRDIVRKKIGNTFAASLGRKKFMVKRYAEVAAKLLDKKFEDKEVVNVLVCPQGPNSIFTLEALKKYRTVKYFTWIMDDHLLQFADGKWQYAKGIEAIYKKHLQDAQHIFVISPAMQQFYKERFGVDSTVLFGSSDKTEDANTTLEPAEDIIKLGYFGAVAGWQTDALEATAKALGDSKAELHIYSGIESLPDNLNLPGVHFKGKLAPDDVLPTMRHYNAVLLPISFTAEFRNMSQFNIATKMSEYLASGVPILAVGPNYAAMIKYLQEHQAAVTISSADVQEIEKGITSLHDKELVASVLNHANYLALSETGSIPMRNRWLAVAKQ